MLWSLLLGCTGPTEEKNEPPTPAVTDAAAPLPVAYWEDLAGVAPTNLVIIQADTLRADHLPFYGYHRDTMPRVSAREGWIVQPHHFATSSWTAPTTASVMTGQDLHNHGLRDPAVDSQSNNIDETFGELLASQGYEVGLFTGNDLLSADLGTGQGWNPYVLSIKSRNSADDLIGRAIEWVDTTTGPFVLFVQPMDTHQTWYPEGRFLGTWSNPDALPFGLTDGREQQQIELEAVFATGGAAEIASAKEQVIALYDEEILGLDAAIDTLMLHLEERGILDETLIVLTADHGETLFDVGTSYGHGLTVRQELVQIPLVFFHSSFQPSALHDCMSWSVDMFPTLLDVLGQPSLDDIDGRSLLSDACRDTVHASLYRAGPGEILLSMVTVNNDRARLEYNCMTGQVVAYDLRFDPKARITRTLADVPEAAVLIPEMESIISEILTKYPDLVCNAGA